MLSFALSGQATVISFAKQTVAVLGDLGVEPVSEGTRQEPKRHEKQKRTLEYPEHLKNGCRLNKMLTFFDQNHGVKTFDFPRIEIVGGCFSLYGSQFDLVFAIPAQHPIHKEIAKVAMAVEK